MRTGGSALPRGIGCGATGATGAADAVSAQNQPIVDYWQEMKCRTKRKRGKGYKAEEDVEVAEIIGEETPKGFGSTGAAGFQSSSPASVPSRPTPQSVALRLVQTSTPSEWFKHVFIGSKSAIVQS